MTSTKELNKQAYQYILDCIDGSEYNTELKTDKERLQFLYDTFKQEFSWNVERIGEIKAFTEYLQGLPSCFRLEFYNDEIIKLAVKWGSLSENATEGQQNRIISNYWNFITNKTFQLFRKYGII